MNAGLSPDSIVVMLRMFPPRLQQIVQQLSSVQPAAIASSTVGMITVKRLKC